MRLGSRGRFWSTLVNSCLRRGPPNWAEGHTSLCRLPGFFYTPVACRRGFYGCSGGRGRGLGKRCIDGAWCGLWLRGLLLLFAAAKEAAEASSDLG